VLAIVRDHAPGLPVVIVTETDAAARAVAAIAAGLDGYIVFDPDQPAGVATALRSVASAGSTVAAISDRDAQGRLSELRAVLSGARCLVWHAQVEDIAPGASKPVFEWTGWEMDEAAAQRFLPLDVPIGGRYIDAFYWAGTEVSREQSDEVVALALREGHQAYSQELHRVDREGRSRWLQEQVTVRPVDQNRWHLVGVCVDITERRLMEEALRQSEEQRGTMLQRILGVHEEERARIAQQLHEQVGQAVASLAVALRAAETETTLAALRERVVEVRTSAASLTEEVRQLATEMRPRTLEDLGFGPALERHARELADQWGFQLDFHLYNDNHRILPEELEVVLYRVTHEVLTNAAQHARAENVEVIARYYETSVTVMIQDDGIGFDAEAVLEGPVEGRFGMFAMQERMRMVAGSVSVESLPDEGTVVFVDVPLPTA
jgi:signal transduction histidine kinase